MRYGVEVPSPRRRALEEKAQPVDFDAMAAANLDCILDILMMVEFRVFDINFEFLTSGFSVGKHRQEI